MRDRPVRNACEVGDPFVLPGGSEFFRQTSARLGIPGVADFPPIGDHSPGGFTHRFFGMDGCDLPNALVALAVVIRADVEEIVLLPVVPADYLSLAHRVLAPCSGYFF